MRVFIAGIDGYLGWALANSLAAQGHVVGGLDLFLRRRWVEEMGSHSIVPILPMVVRREVFAEHYGRDLSFCEGDLCDYAVVERALREFQPDAIVHLGEVPSAPYSMIDVHHAVFTQTNNVVGTLNLLFAMHAVCPAAHLVKLGTMGEYGTPAIAIPEGFFEVEFRGRRDTLPFPRQANSWYHWSKVHDSNNVMFACKVWGLRSTDIMQGVVFGAMGEAGRVDERLATRFDIDQSFGTAINRFCAQAVIGHPLTPFGKGHQRRGFLPLEDSMQCLTLALMHPPNVGEYRVFNQFADVYDITALAQMVRETAEGLGLPVEVHNVDNPRMESEEHYYEPDHHHLADLGYRPTRDVREELRRTLVSLVRYRDRIEAKRQVLIPDIRWDGTRRRSDYVEEPMPAIEPG